MNADPDPGDVLEKWLMSNAVRSLHIKPVRQREFIELTGNGLGLKRCNLPLEDEVYIGRWLRGAFRSRAEEYGARNLAMRRKHLTNETEFTLAESCTQDHDWSLPINQAWTSFIAGR